MSKEELLSRLEADLARGHTHLAAQRLATLMSAYPDDLEIRARRGAFHHRIGNFAEAGRWGYLTEDVDPADLLAFERAFKRPSDRLRALRLGRDPSARLGPAARARLEILTRSAADGQAEPQESAAATVAAITCAVVIVLGVLTLFGLAVYGYLALFDII